MTRTELEAKIWAITGRELSGAAVDALLNVADEYAAGVRSQRPVLRHTSPADLWPVIGALAEAMLGGTGSEDQESARLRMHLGTGTASEYERAYQRSQKARAA